MARGRHLVTLADMSVLSIARVLPTLALLASLIALGACENDPGARVAPDAGPARPPATVRGECRYFELENGQMVCAMTEPQGPIAMEDLSGMGPRVEALVDPVFTGTIPTAVDLRAQSLDGCLQVRNQIDCGWCVVHAVGALLDALYCAEGCPPPRVSMPHLYANGNGDAIGDCGHGWSVDDAVGSLTTTPLVPESEWAYTSSGRGMSSTRPSDETLTAEGRYRATGSSMIANDSNKLDNIKRVLASGRAVTVWSGLCFSAGWSSGTGVIDAPMLPCAGDGTSTYDGYHAYTIVGYDETAMTFLALNSWGDDWGDGGYMRLSYEFVEREVSGGGYLHQIDRDHGGCPMADAPDGGVSGDAGIPSGGADGGVPAGPVTRTPAERCAAITGCGACAATSGCVFCDDACVLADASGAGPAEGTCTTVRARASQCPFTDDPCLASADCGSCAVQDGCAWCQGRGVCLPWPSGAATCGDSRVATAGDQCNDVTRACEMATSTGCDGCTMREGCGWCGDSGKCGGGDATGSDRLGCGGEWTGGGVMCPGVSVDAGTPMPPPDASVCGPVDGPCVGDVDCCDGLECIANACRDPAVCGVESASCSLGLDCCGGLSCLPTSLGGPLACCVGFSGANCETNDDCCGEMLCVSGECLDRRLGESCASNTDCEPAARCASGTCVTR